jgi:hypothetical protein
MGVRSLSSASISTGAKRSKFWDQSTVLNSYEAIGTTYVTSATPYVEFSSIPSGYKDLQVRISGVGNGTTMVARFNNDTGSNYSFHRIYRPYSSSTANSDGQTGRTSLAVSYLGNAQSTTQFANIMNILDYSNGTTWTHFVNQNGIDGNGSGNLGVWSGAWFNTAAVHTIRFYGEDGSNVQPFSRFSLYGIKG